MARLGSCRPGITADDIAALTASCKAVDPDVVYLGHHYGCDNWNGAGTPYRTLAAAIRLETAHYVDRWDDWVDAFDLSEYVTNRGEEWWPTTEDGEPYTPDGDSHPYIERAEIKS